MKKLFFAVIAVGCILSACLNPLVDEPFLPGDGAAESRSSSAPDNITATQGGKRSIELSWSEVSGAIRYYIYKADSPLTPFVQCAETTGTRFTFSTAAGSTVYYRVSSVAYNEQESAQSFYVMGSSLAQPVITDITDITEASATVTWYMENATDATYRAHLRYTVYCFNKADGTEVAQLAIDGSQITANRAVFTGLLAEKEYEYQVEAYLVSDQSNSEKSDIVDKKTARRLIPGAPEKLTASRGTSTDTITLSFELPEKIKIALGEDKIEEHEIYFVISKRFHGEHPNNDYKIVCSFLGSQQENDLRPTSSAGSAVLFDKYELGKTVTWTDTSSDTNSIIRGVEYEYQVQSYVDRTPDEERKSKNHTPKTITADTSKAAVTGWALTVGTVSAGKPVYTPNEEGALYVSATVPLTFTFDRKGEEYRYKVLETINPIGDEYEFDPAGKIERESALLSYEQVTAYTAAMNLTQQTTAATPGRGLYAYQVSIHLPDGGTEIDTVIAIGYVFVSEEIAPIVVERFAVQDGYPSQFMVSWDSVDNTQYKLYSSINKTTWNEVATYSAPVASATVPVGNVTGYHADATVYFAMQPIRGKNGQREFLDEGFQTLGVPKLQTATGSYSAITAAWTAAQKADTYRIKYQYTGGNWIDAAEIAHDNLSPDLEGRLYYSFKPNGYDDPTQSGKAIKIEVVALNEGLRAKIESSNEIATTSAEDVQARLIGPAELAAQASKAESANAIELSWNKVAGAGGYYVFRRQFNMNNGTEESGAVVYYIPAQENAPFTVTGKELTISEGTKIDTSIVKAAVSFTASRYTLTDEYMIDHEYSGGYALYVENYRNQQNELAWGFPYRYFIVPVLSDEPLDSIAFAYGQDAITNKNTGVAAYTLTKGSETIVYNNAASLEQTGFTIGFGQNVTATKGTYTANGSANYPVNDGVSITWSAPPLLAGAGVTPQYTVYRKLYNNPTWVPVNTVSTSTYIDTSVSITKGVAYEYLIGIKNDNIASAPGDSARFIQYCRGTTDEKGRPNMLGYMLDMVRMESVSRNEQTVNGNFAEEVKWFSGEVKNNNTDYRWGIDGYTVFVMNRNIDADWHEIADIPYANIANQTNQSVKVTNVQGGDTLAGGLLKVLRDYKHYFKIRSYVLNNLGDKVYSPDPDWNFEALFSQTANRNNQDNANFLQTDYVKWGARQVTPTEFTRVATLFLAWGIHTSVGGTSNSWQSTLYAAWKTTSNNGSSGRTGCQSNAGVGRWYLYFDNYKPDLDTNANRGNWTYSTTFVAINGSSDTYSNRNIYADCYGAGCLPDWYGNYTTGGVKYGGEFISINGPSCVAPLYSGQLRFNGFSWTSGNVEVKYPVSAAAVQITNAQANSPLPLQGQPNASYSSTTSRRFDADEWY